jgi:hypothetical protein
MATCYRCGYTHDLVGWSRFGLCADCELELTIGEGNDIKCYVDEESIQHYIEYENEDAIAFEIWNLSEDEE